MDLHVRIRLMERHVIDQANAMDHPGGAVMSFIIGDASSMLRCLHLLDQKGMVAFFDTQNVVKIVVLQDLNRRSMGTQAVVGDDALEGGVSLTPLGNEPFGGSALTIIVVRSSLVHDPVQASRGALPDYPDGQLPRPTSDEHTSRSRSGGSFADTTRRESSERKKNPSHRETTSRGHQGTSWVPAPCRAGVAERHS
jgi:hypothetical protein